MLVDYLVLVRPFEILIDPIPRPKGNNDVLRHFLSGEKTSMVRPASVS